MTLPDAGWFPDPQDSARMRWWDGLTWSAETRPAPRAAAVLAGAQGGEVAAAAPARPVFSIDTGREPDSTGSQSDASLRGPKLREPDRDAASGRRRDADPPRRMCVLSWGALLLAGVSALANPYGLVGLVALLLAVIGVLRPFATGGWRVAARSAAFSALVLAGATTLIAANATLQLA